MKTAIVLTLDANYIEYAAVFLESLSDNYHHKDDIDVVCIMPEEDAKAFNDLRGLVNLDKRLNLMVRLVGSELYKWTEESLGRDDLYQHSKVLWYRLFLGSILHDYNKAIYFEPDMLVVDNVYPIISHPMYNKFMAVYDVIGVPYEFGKGRGDVAWMTTGTLIIDLDWWRDADIESLLVADLKANGFDEILDEDLFNKLLKPYWHPLPLGFNFYLFTRDAYGVPDYDSSPLPLYHKHAIVYHFPGRVKPWTYKEIITKTDYSRITAEWYRYKKRIDDRKSNGSATSS